MQEPAITTKIAPAALDQLRRIAQATGEKQIRALTRVLEAEAARLGLKRARPARKREAAE
jgi:hypothetical protein